MKLAEDMCTYLRNGDMYRKSQARSAEKRYVSPEAFSMNSQIILDDFEKALDNFDDALSVPMKSGPTILSRLADPGLRDELGEKKLWLRSIILR